MKDIECFPAGPPLVPCHNSSIDYLNHFIIVLSSMEYYTSTECPQVY